MEVVLLLAILAMLAYISTNLSSKLGNLETQIKQIQKLLKEQPVVKSTTVQPAAEQKAPVFKAPPPPPPVPETKKEEKPPVIPVNIRLPKAEEVKPEPVQPVVPKPESKTENTPPPPPKKQPAPVPVIEEDWYDKFRKNNPDLEKFIGENLLSKVAIVILVLGIAFFVKYAIDREWINEVGRVGIGILCGGIVLGFAHYLHKRFKAFSSVLVAGGIAIFYFTIAIGFHQYHLFSQAVAFTIMVLITCFAVFISLAYDRMELAVLSLLGGFAAPFTVSTGEGNYVVLFTYLLILNSGMLVLSYFRKWNLIKIISYVLTQLIFTAWVYTKLYSVPGSTYQGALLFGSLFYLLFMVMTLLNNLREKLPFRELEISILLTNTFLYYGSGMYILNQYHPELQGLFTIAVGMFNMAMAFLLYKVFKVESRLLYLLIGLTLTFSTLAAPVQLEGNNITLFWALEAVLLLWLAQKSRIVLYRFTSVLVTGMMVISLCGDWVKYYSVTSSVSLPVLLNRAFLTSLVSAATLFLQIFLIRRERTAAGGVPYEAQIGGINHNSKIYSRVLKLMLPVLLYLTGLIELFYQLSEYYGSDTLNPVVGGAYHLTFVLLLNLVAGKTENEYARNALMWLNIASLALLVVALEPAALHDTNSQIIRQYPRYIGFSMHYLSLLSGIGLAFVSYRKYYKTGMADRSPGQRSSFILLAAIAFVCSIELLIHGMKISLPDTGSDSQASYWELKKIRIQYIKIGFPVLWGIISLVFLTIGMRRHIRFFRVGGLLLIAITVLKLFTYDIKDASEAGKIIAFILLGIVLLIISFMYQKIKALLMEDKPKNP